MSSLFYKRTDSNSMSVRSPKASLSLWEKGGVKGLVTNGAPDYFLARRVAENKKIGISFEFVR